MTSVNEIRAQLIELECQLRRLAKACEGVTVEGPMHSAALVQLKDQLANTLIELDGAAHAAVLIQSSDDPAQVATLLGVDQWTLVDKLLRGPLRQGEAAAFWENDGTELLDGIRAQLDLTNLGIMTAIDNQLDLTDYGRTVAATRVAQPG